MIMNIVATGYLFGLDIATFFWSGIWEHGWLAFNEFSVLYLLHCVCQIPILYTWRHSWQEMRIVQGPEASFSSIENLVFTAET
jgi:hypothetical protein